MATADEYAAWIVKNADKKGTPEFETVAAAYADAKGSSAPDSKKETSLIGDIKQGAGNLVAGAVRGAGSIGATILTPYDLAVGNTKSISNPERRNAMDNALQTLGAEPDSVLYKGGKLAGEVAGTAGAGSVVANGARAVGASAPLVNAIRSAGFTTGANPATTGAVGNALTRATGGAITGAASAGMVDPGEAGTGAIVGGALPSVAQVSGRAGNAIGRVVSGPAQSADTAAAIQAARANGYVIPPTQANPTLLNRTLEGFSGKLTTAQNASAKNQAVTNSLAAKSLGLPEGEKITADTLKSVRDTAGKAYQDIGSTGVIAPGKDYVNALDDIAAPFVKASQGFPNAKASPVLDLVDSLRSPSFDAASAVEKIKQLRTAADDAFRSGNTDVARASKSAATALEDAVDMHLQTIGKPDLLQNFRDARQLIAKSYSVEKALNPTTGSIDARKLAAQLNKGKPLSGDLKDAAEFANRFPKAAQASEGMGSLPQTSPLDWAVGGGMSAATANPLMMAGVMARPAARALTLSTAVQNRLIQNHGPNALQRMIANSGASQLGFRAAPVLAADH